MYPCLPCLSWLFGTHGILNCSLQSWCKYTLHMRHFNADAPNRNLKFKMLYCDSKFRWSIFDIFSTHFFKQCTHDSDRKIVRLVNSCWRIGKFNSLWLLVTSWSGGALGIVNSSCDSTERLYVLAFSDISTSSQIFICIGGLNTDSILRNLSNRAELGTASIVEVASIGPSSFCGMMILAVAIICSDSSKSIKLVFSKWLNELFPVLFNFSF